MTLPSKEKPNGKRGRRIYLICPTSYSKRELDAIRMKEEDIGKKALIMSAVSFSAGKWHYFLWRNKNQLSTGEGENNRLMHFIQTSPYLGIAMSLENSNSLES